MSANCAGCNSKIMDLNYMECSKCQLTYDLLCIGMSVDVFTNLTETSKNEWLCPTCVSLLPKTGNSSTPVRSLVTLNNTYTRTTDYANINLKRGSEPHVYKHLHTSPSSPPQPEFALQIQDLRIFFDNKLEAIKKEILDEWSIKIHTFEESILQIIHVHHHDFVQKIESLDLTINNMKTEQTNIGKIIDNLSGEISTLKTNMASIETENNLLKSKLSVLESLQQNLGDVEQRARLNNLEFFGIPERKSENLVSLVSQLAAALGVAVTGEDIDYATRLPTRVKNNGLPKTVIVKFKSIMLRDSLLSAARKKRGLTSADIQVPGDIKPIYINEHLTIRNKALLKAVRVKCKELGFQNVWTRNAKIYIRRHHRAPAVRIFDLEQMANLGKKTES